MLYFLFFLFHNVFTLHEIVEKIQLFTIASKISIKLKLHKQFQYYVYSITIYFYSCKIIACFGFRAGRLSKFK